MVKAPQSHGLNRKYKPWRKGKSEKAKSNRGSLKQQLRGQERLLAKTTDDKHRQTIEEKIAEFKSMISEKQNAERQRENARKSHGKRFLERQRLTRMERNTKKNPNLSKEARERELTKIALDLVYVAHYPLDVRYLNLFRGSTRVVDARRQLVKRAITRQRVLQMLQEPRQERVKWISEQQYSRLPSDWSVENERETFGEAKPTSRKRDEIHDDRFAMDAKHSTLLEVADQIESKLQEEDEKVDSNKQAKDAEDSDSDSSDGEEHEDARIDQGKEVDRETDSDSSSSSDEETSSSDESQEANPLTEQSKPSAAPADADEGNDSESSSDNSSSSSFSSSSSSSDSSSDDEKMDVVKTKEAKEDKGIFGGDDFLVADETIDEHEVFARAQRHTPAEDEVRGDKSKGWATQRQRPGQFKKRRVRR